jgi:hypothetical protein
VAFTEIDNDARHAPEIHAVHHLLTCGTSPISNCAEPHAGCGTRGAECRHHRTLRLSISAERGERLGRQPGSGARFALLHGRDANAHGLHGRVAIRARERRAAVLDESRRSRSAVRTELRAREHRRKAGRTRDRVERGRAIVTMPRVGGCRRAAAWAPERI